MQTRSQVKSKSVVGMQLREQKQEMDTREGLSVKTRSQTRLERRMLAFAADIDFDRASRAWRANKRSIGNGQFAY
jgi:hypothetical protein